MGRSPYHWPPCGKKTKTIKTKPPVSMLLYMTKGFAYEIKDIELQSILDYPGEPNVNHKGAYKREAEVRVPSSHKPRSAGSM